MQRDHKAPGCLNMTRRQLSANAFVAQFVMLFDQPIAAAITCDGVAKVITTLLRESRVLSLLIEETDRDDVTTAFSRLAGQNRSFVSQITLLFGLSTSKSLDVGSRAAIAADFAAVAKTMEVPNGHP